MKLRYIVFTLGVFCSFLMSSSVEKFSITKKEDNRVSIAFSNEEIIISSKDGFDYITENKNSTIDEGFPSLPSYSFSYGVDPSKEYSIELNILSSHVINDIDIYPYQSPKMEKKNSLVINDSFYNSSLNYPSSNIFHSRSVIRGNEILTINVIPSSYMPSTNQLTVFDEIEIIIEETGDRIDHSSLQKKSRIFQKIYNGMILDTFDNREIDFQDPSILYICDNDVGSNNTAFNNLLEWRRRQGYEVNVASLSQTGSSASSIKNYILNAYNNWENPPEFICLVGDANGSYSVPTYEVGEGGGWYGAQAESDLPYVLIEGDDSLPDITIGRISIRSSSELTTVASKIVGYEKLYGGTDWIDNVALVGDPSDSGISTTITNEYIALIMENYGVDNINEQYSGNYESFMRNQLNNGVSYLNYRGFYGFSGFDSNTVDQLSNGYKLPFLTTLTCDTGSFEEEQNSICETLVKAGSASNPKGAVAVVATAQPYTHTAFNNIVAMGMYSGIFLYGAETAGEALAYGQLAIHQTYPQNPNNNVDYFSAWNNLMGDPATLLWTDTPKNLVVDYINNISASDDLFNVYIIDDEGNPIEGANVNLTNGSDLYVNAQSDIHGYAYVSLEGFSGSTFITVSCQDCVPYEEDFIVNSTLMPEVVNSSVSVLDSDGFLSPGEIVDVNFDIDNNTSSDFSNILVTISSSNQNVVSEDVIIPSMNAFQTVNVTLGLSLPIDILPDTEPLFYVKISSAGDNSYQLLNLDIASGSTALNSLNISGAGETSSVQVRLNNIGDLDLTNISGDIIYTGSQLTFSTSELNWASADQNSNSISNYIDISVSDYVIDGKIFNVPVFITSENSSYEQIVSLQITAGNVTTFDPLGPDSYGYYIYDNTDVEYDLAPIYDWVEISETGTYLSQIYDGGNNQDKSTTISLPFTFTFYGLDYEEITICSNGWVSFGRTTLESFRNYPIPGTGGPSPMVAGFWDDLEDGQTYYQYDAENDRFIIQWDDQELYFDNSYSNTFQIILYNTGADVITGDDEILIQYKDFNNESEGYYPVGNYSGAVVHGQYASVGIEDHTGLDGLEYTFNDGYPTAAARLGDNSALFITTRDNSSYLIGDINQDSDINILDVVLAVNIVLNVDEALTNITAYQEYVSDINQDSTINILDIVLLIELILGS